MKTESNGTKKLISMERWLGILARKFEFVCEKLINRRMLICVACVNGSFEYRIEPSKQGGTDYA